MKGALRFVPMFTRLVAWGSSLRRRALPPQFALMELATAIWPAMALRAVVKAGILDRLASGAASPREIADELQLHEPSVARILRLLAGYDIVRASRDGKIHLTAIGRYAARSTPGNVGDFLEYVGEPWQLGPWSHLDETLRTGEPAFDAVYGSGFFDYARAHPEVGSHFDRAMTVVAELHAVAVAEAFDFSNASPLVDVGGGRGALLRAIFALYPNVEATLYDLPAAVAHADPEVAARARIVAGDFFERIPGPAKTFTLSHILHDWDDEAVVAILRNIVTQLMPGGRVLIIEALLDERPNQWTAATLTDAQMLTMLHGRERTAREFDELVSKAGLRVERVIPSAAAESIIVCMSS